MYFAVLAFRVHRPLHFSFSWNSASTLVYNAESNFGASFFLPPPSRAPLPRPSAMFLYYQAVKIYSRIGLRKLGAGEAKRLLSIAFYPKKFFIVNYVYWFRVIIRKYLKRWEDEEREGGEEEVLGYHARGRDRQHSAAKVSVRLEGRNFWNVAKPLIRSCFLLSISVYTWDIHKLGLIVFNIRVVSWDNFLDKLRLLLMVLQVPTRCFCFVFFF